MSLYKKRIAAGLCGSCGADDPGGSLCATCKEKAKQRAAEKRAKRKEAGACLACGRPKEPGKSKCSACLTRDRNYRSEQIEQYKRAGKCQSCGGEPKPGRTLCQACIDARSAVSSKRYRTNRENGKCGYCGSDVEADHVLCKRCRGVQDDLRAREKLAAFNAYGGPVCCVCGEDDIAILEVDHINGGGCKHRRSIKNLSIYRWLKQHDYPPGFRVLCPTCNKKAHVQARACP